jgi:hypothetical protein
MRLEIFQGKIGGHTHPLTCRQIVAGREAGSALDLCLTLVRFDDLLRGSRHAEQLLAERVGPMNDMNVLWIHRGGGLISTVAVHVSDWRAIVPFPEQ